MEISVVIPLYNNAFSIERCLYSVLNQTYKTEYQIIVVNDGSTDHSESIVRKFMKENNANIELINKKNGGAASARNVGLKMAKGIWIALLDSDDEWLPDKIEKQMRVLKMHPDIDFLGCNVTSWRASILGRRKKTLSKIKLWEQFISWYPSTPTVMFKREVLSDVGYYDEEMTHGEDGQFLLRMLMKRECWFMPDALVDIGGGKPTFGSSGLSANLHAMQHGQMRILKYAYKYQQINSLQLALFTMYAILKHWRRVVITKLR